MYTFHMDLYHIFNRGVEKKDIVNDDDDRMRFVRSLYLFNDVNPAPNSISQLKQCNELRKRECLVHIHAWCLMNNHYHLLLSPTNDDTTTISKFMKKLGMGYAKFFNEKYGRSGHLWQGKFKRVHVENDSQLIYIPYYIHLNPLDYTMPKWRIGGINDTMQAFENLKRYRWSSYNDYQNIPNFVSVINKSFLQGFLGNVSTQNKQIKNIISVDNQQHTISSNGLEN